MFHRGYGGWGGINWKGFGFGGGLVVISVESRFLGGHAKMCE